MQRVELGQKVLSENARIASELRERFRRVSTTLRHMILEFTEV
jgi:hypothetical protein